MTAKTRQPKITTTSTSKPDSPTKRIENFFDLETFIVKIEAIPNHEFAQKGRMIIQVNGRDIFNDEEQAGIFSNVSLMNIPLIDNKLEPTDTIDFFLWNDIDSDSLDLSLNITISTQNKSVQGISNPINPSDKNNSSVDAGTKTSPDGGSGITATVYTCPSGFKAKIKKLVTRVRGTGSATKVHLLVNGTRLKTWQINNGNPTEHDTLVGGGGDAWVSNDTLRGRNVWLDSSYAGFNLAYEDLKDLEIDEDVSIAYDGDFSGNFNASVDFAYSILETRK